MNSRVLVLGGGTAGMTAALELANMGIEVYLVEKSPGLGGRAINYCCKATSQCNQCGACLVPQLKVMVEDCAEIKLITNSKVKNIVGKPGDYRVTIGFLSGSRGLDLGAETTLAVAAVVIAIGLELLDFRGGEFGFGLHKGVISTFDLQKALKERGSLMAAFDFTINKVGFVPCTDSRNLSFGSSFCSRICCTYTDKLVKLLQHMDPDLGIDIFYNEQQWNGREADQGSIRYLRGTPAKVFRYPNDYLTVRYADTSNGQVEESNYNLLVYCPVVRPVRDLEDFSAELGLKYDDAGFLTGQDQDGIFATGACTGPRDIPQSIAQTKATVGKVMQFLQRNQ